LPSALADGQKKQYILLALAKSVSDLAKALLNGTPFNRQLKQTAIEL
jgi:hypothetical protein